jgi:hypothetical protein
MTDAQAQALIRSLGENPTDEEIGHVRAQVKRGSPPHQAQLLEALAVLRYTTPPLTNAPPSSRD